MAVDIDTNAPLNTDIPEPPSAPTASVSDAAYDATWNGITDVAPSKNAVYDKIETLVVGPVSATDNAIPRFDTTTGKLIQDSAITVADLSAGQVVISAVDAVVANIDINLNPKGAGIVKADGAEVYRVGVGSIVRVQDGGTGVAAGGATTTVLVGGGTTSPAVWTTATGSGAPVRATSPTFVTPALGTPTALVLTNATGLPVAGGGTGVSTISALSIWVANALNTIVQVTPAAGQSVRINAGATAWEAFTPGAGGGGGDGDTMFLALAFGAI